MANNQIKVGVGFQVDKSSLKDLESSLRQIQIEAAKAKGSGKLTKDLEESAKAAEKLEDILNQSWNNKLNQLDLHKVNKGIKETYGNVSGMKKELEKSGIIGTKAYNDIASAILTTNMQLRTSNKLLDEMAQSMANTIKWGITSSIFNNITNSISQAYNYTKRLDSSLNDIRIVTDKSAESMEQFARQANEAAKGLGASTLDYTEASLIYYQQGLEEEDVAARAETTLKAANVTGQYAEEVSEQLTAVWNGYKVSAQEAELYIDKLAAVATGTASDLEELSTGMSKVASAANSMGVDIDQLNAQLATIVSVTRQAPESVGTALKTIYARMSDLKMGGTDEEGLGLGEVSGTMETMGIQVLDATGNLREIGDVIEEVATKWDTWTEAQKTAMAQVMAGKRQYNNLVALFENWDMYTDALNMSTNAAGTLQEQQDIYMESTAAHLQQLRTEAEKTYDILFDQDTVNGFADALTGVLGIFNNFIEGLGGGTNAFMYFGSIVGKIFSKQITEGIINAKNNFNVLKANLGDEDLKTQLIEASVTSINKQSGIKVDDEAYQAQYDVAKKIFDVRKGLSQEQYNETIEITKQIGLEKQELVLLEKQKKSREQLFDKDKNQQYINELLAVGGFNANKLISSGSDSADRAEAMDLLNKELNILKEKKDTYSDIILALNSGDKIRIQNIAKTKEQKDILAKLGLTEEQIVAIRKQGNIETEVEDTLLKKINAERDREKTKIQSIYNFLSLINPELAEQIQKHEEILELLNGQNQQYVDIGQKNMNTQKIVDYAMAAAQAMTALNGTLKVFSDESSTGEEKAHALGSAIGGIGGAVAGLIGGPWGIALSMIIPVLSDIIFSFDFIEDGFKSSAEKLAELNEQQEEYINKTKEFTNSKKSLEEVADEYEKLSEKAGDYDENINSLTESERKRYNELKDTVLQYNQDALLGYNAEGEAILKKNQGIQETIDLLKEEYEQQVKNKFIENWEKTTQTKQDIISDANKKVSNIDKKIANIDYDTQNQEYQTSLKQQITTQVQNDIGLADEDKQKLNTYLTNNSFDEVKNLISQSKATNKDYIIQLIDNLNFTNPDKLKEKLEEEKKAAELELEAVKKFDGQLIANTIKYIEDYNKGWTELESLEIEGSDVFLNKFIDSLEYSENFGYDEAYAAADKYAQNLAKVLKSIQKQGLDPEKFLADLKVNPHDFDTIEEYQQAVKNKIVELLKDPVYDTMSTDEKGQFFTATFGIDVVFNDDGTFEADAEKYKEKIKDFWNRTRLDGGDLAVLGQGISQTELEKILGPEYIDRLSEIEGLLNKDTIATQGWVVALQNAKAELDKIDAQNAIVNLGDNVDNLTNSFLAGDVTSENIVENKDFQAINNQIDQIIEKYPELTAAAETFKNTHLVGTQLWTEALEMLQDKINEVKLDKLRDEYDKVKEEIFTDDDGNEISIEAFLESETFEEDLTKILNADYAINVEIHAQAEQAFEQTQSSIENLKEQASKIGDNFIVAAEDIRELNNAFPGIIESMQDLGNGTIKLNKKIVESAMDAAYATAAADGEATNEKLKNAYNELAAKQKVYKSMLSAARALAAGSVRSDEASALHKQVLLDGIASLNEETTQSELDNNFLVAENADANAAEVAKSWNDAYHEAAQDAYAFGVTAVSAHTAAQTGKMSDLKVPPQFDINYTGGTGVSDDANTIEKQQELFDKYAEDNYAQLITELEQLIESTDAELIDIAGMMAENGAVVRSADKTFDNISKGKGSDGKSDRNKEQKKAEDEIDRYWELNKAIENVEESLSDLDKQQEKLYGKEKINSLREENKLLAQQADRYKALAAEQRKEAGELQGILSNYGVVFDAQGAVSNYLAATQAMLNQYNQAVAAYNAGLIDEVTFGVTEKAYENFKATLERYETLYYQEMRETQNKLDEIHRQELENNLEAWEIEIQLKLDMKELKRQWNDFFKEINENFKLVYEDLGATMNNLVKNSKTYVGKDGDITTIRKAISDVTKEIDKMRSGGSSDMFESISQAQEKLKELNTDLQDAAIGLRDLWEEAWDTYLEGIDQAAEQFEDIMEQYETVNEQIEYQKELIELLYGDEAYELMAEYYDAQLENTLAQAESLKQQADMWKAQYEAAKMRDEQTGKTSEDTEKFYENWQKAQQGVNDKVKDYIKLLKDEYKNTVNGVLDDLEKKMMGGKTLDEVKTQWELLQKQTEGYYDDVEKIYQLSTLENKYEQAIANTSSVKNQQKLQELYDQEMKYLKEKKFLSEYDIDIANAKYDMTLKQIALEEAQQNKSTMKLTRGTDGNWSYQYVADENDIASKQQELMDATNNYYQTAKQGYNEIIEDMLSAKEQYFERYAEIANADYENEALRKIAFQELEEAYYGDNGIITNMMLGFQERKTNVTDATLKSILGYYAIDQENYDLMTKEEQRLIDGLKDGTISNYDEMLTKATDVCKDTLAGWDSAATSIADTWYNNEDSIKKEILNSYDKIEEANEEYKKKVNELAKSVDKDFSKDGIKGDIDTARKATQDLEKDTENLVDTVEKELPKYRKKVEEIEKAWYSVRDSIQSSIRKIEEYLGYAGNATRATQELANSLRDAASAQRELNAAKAAEPSGSTTSPTTNTSNTDEYYYVQTGKTETTADGRFERLFSVYKGTYPNGSSVAASQRVSWIKENYPSAVQKGKTFNTGGYTGEWNNGDTDGRLAWLHQKELILNAADTKNILAVVNTVREMTHMSDSIESAIMQNIGKMVGSLMNLGSYEKSYQPVLATTEGATENIFNITAEFPNADDVTSIREAILSLPNIASQYMARNKK